MIEGEEEIGSKSLGGFVKENREKLANDVILISDTGILANDTPSITTGLRGLSYVEVEVTGPNRDLHSGLYGGAVANPINILAQMIASLQDHRNRITIPGFYDKVIELSAAERADMARAPFSLEAYKASLDLKDVHGEEGYVTMERNCIRPTLDVNGIWGGYTGEGAKTVIPARASAKISMRLVPDQDPDEITRLFTEHFIRIAPPGRAREGESAPRWLSVRGSDRHSGISGGQQGNGGDFWQNSSSGPQWREHSDRQPFRKRTRQQEHFVRIRARQRCDPFAERAFRTVQFL